MRLIGLTACAAAALMVLGGCSGDDAAEDVTPSAVDEPVVTSEAPTPAVEQEVETQEPEPATAEPEPTTEPVEEPTEDATTAEDEQPAAEPEQPPAAAASSSVERADELREVFRVAHPEATSNLEEGLTCDAGDVLVDGEMAISGCATNNAGIIFFFVPDDRSIIDQLSSELMNEAMMSTCIGADYVAATGSLDGAYLIDEAMDCTFP